MNYADFPTKGERTRAHIVATAAEMFWQRSFNGVSVDEIADAASVNKATIYRYFADKGDLALAATRHQGAVTLEQIFEASFAAHETPDQRLVAIYSKAYRGNIEMKEERGDLLGCPVLGLVLELGFDMPEIRREAGHIFDRVQSYFTGIARDAIAAGRTDGAPDKIGRALMQLHHGACASSRIAAEPEYILDAGRTSLRLIGYPEAALAI